MTINSHTITQPHIMHLMKRYIKQIKVISTNRKKNKVMLSVITNNGKAYTRHVPAYIYNQLATDLST